MDKTSVTTTLDRIEGRLPAVPQRLLKLNRTVAAAGYDALSASASAVWSAAKNVTQRSTTGAKTVSGQAESVARRIGSTVTSGAKEVAGQAKAQTSATLDLLEDETVDLLDSATAAVEDAPSGSYETRSKADLYERAQELEIEGRSVMSKDELISALRSVG